MTDAEKIQRLVGQLEAAGSLILMADDPIVCEWCGEDIPEGHEVQLYGSSMHSACAVTARIFETSDD